MANRKRLSEPAEDDLLMCDIARQTYAVNAHSLILRTARPCDLLLLVGMPLHMRGTHLSDHGRRLHSRTRGCVQLIVMVKLNDFHIWHIFCRHTAHEHHEDSTNGKIGCDECRSLVLVRRRLDRRLLLLCESRRSDDGRNLVCECRQDVSVDHIGARKVNHYIRLQTRERCRQISLNKDAVCRRPCKFARIRAAHNVNRANQLQFGIIQHGFQHRASHASRSAIYQNLCQGNPSIISVCRYSSPENPRMSRNTIHSRHVLIKPPVCARTAHDTGA